MLAEQRPDAGRLRAICDVKLELGGRVVRDTGEPLTQARELFPIGSTTTTTEDDGVQGEFGGGIVRRKRG